MPGTTKHSFHIYSPQSHRIQKNLEIPEVNISSKVFSKCIHSNNVIQVTTLNKKQLQSSTSRLLEVKR